MLPLAYFGIESRSFGIAVDLLIVSAVVLYGAIIWWTWSDARRRIEDGMLIGCATLAAILFPFIGALVYIIVRPPEYLDDVRERELEMEAAEARLRGLDHGLCPNCEEPVERDFLRCPSCLRKLKERCASCSKPLDREWAICPYCETEVAGASRSRRSRRRETVADLTSEDRDEMVSDGEPLRAERDSERTSEFSPDLAPEFVSERAVDAAPRRSERASRVRGRPRPGAEAGEDLV
jgi:Double zinc ribbon